MIDKSLRQYYENGKEVDPYRKGLEIIAGKGKDTIQTTAPGKITARNLIKPAEKMTLPSVRKDKTVPSITTLPKTARPSFDQKKYSGLASAFYDKLKEGEESYLDKYINRDPVRTAGGVEEWGEDYDYLTSSAAPDTALAAAPDTALAAAPDKLLAQLVTSPQIDTAITSTGEGETATSYNDTQIQNIFENADTDTKNFITNSNNTDNIITKTYDILGSLNIDKSELAKGFITRKVGDVVATKLGISGGAAGGPVGMIIGGIIGWLANKVTGGKKEETEEIEGIFSFADEGSTDKPVDKPTVEDTAAMEDIITAPPKRTVTYTPPVRHHTGGNGGGRNGGGGKGSSPSDAPGSPFAKGGRIDKALGGRSRYL